MKKINWIYVLICLFITRIILIPTSISDSLCLLFMLAYLFLDRYVKAKKVEDQIMQEVKDAREEMKKAKESVEAVKIATGFGVKRG